MQLDALTEEISILFVNHATFSNRELALFESTNQINPQISEMNSKFGQRIELEQEWRMRMQKDLEISKVGFMNAETRFKN